MVLAYIDFYKFIGLNDFFRFYTSLFLSEIAVKRKIFYLAVCGAAGALLMLVLLLVLRWYCVKRKRNSFSATSLHKKV